MLVLVPGIGKVFSMDTDRSTDSSCIASGECDNVRDCNTLNETF